MSPISRPLPPPAQAYRDALPPGHVEHLRIDALDRLGFPVSCVTFWPEDGPGNGGNGYGADADEAVTGAFGELTETACSWGAIGRLPRTRASWAELRVLRGAGDVLDPRMAPLPAGSAWTPDTPLVWAPMRRHPDGGEVLVPVELVASQPADLRPGDPGPDEWLTLPISNGMGAGPTRSFALAHALLEILQRHGNGIAFRAMDEGVVLDLDEVADPVVHRLLDRLDAAGIDVLAKVADTSFAIPNLFVVGIDRKECEAGAPIMSTSCGEAAHPDRERALRKALLEFGAARARKAFTHGPLDAVEAITPAGYMDRFRTLDIALEERRALDDMVSWSTLDHDDFRRLLAGTVLAETTRVPFSTLPTSGPISSPDDLCTLLVGRLAAEGLDVLVADLTPPGHAVAAVKAFVPGLEVETMTYHRIGARNVARLLERGSSLVGTGPPPPGARPVLLREEDEQRFGGSAWLDVGAVDRVVGPLYPLYREPGRHVAPLVAAGVLVPTP